MMLKLAFWTFTLAATAVPSATEYCTGIAYNNKKSICCDGVLQKRPRHSQDVDCCGTTTYLTKTQQCCQSTPSIMLFDRPTENHYCCGIDKVYNSITEKCCNDVITSINPYIIYGCCGADVYRYSTQLCCNGVVRPKPIGGGSCCGQTEYSYQMEICCDGEVLRRPSIRPKDWNCCGTELIHKSHVCCGGISHVKPEGCSGSCCDQAPFNYDTQLCCGGVVHDQPMLYSSSYLCCGKDMYYSRNRLCCAGQILFKPNANYSCCGNANYNTISQICCGGQVVSKSYGIFTYCCGLTLYDIRRQICCSSTLQERGAQGPYARCCGTAGFDLRTHHCCRTSMKSRKPSSRRKSSNRRIGKTKLQSLADFRLGRKC